MFSYTWRLDKGNKWSYDRRTRNNCVQFERSFRRNAASWSLPTRPRWFVVHLISYNHTLKTPVINIKRSWLWAREKNKRANAIDDRAIANSTRDPTIEIDRSVKRRFFSEITNEWIAKILIVGSRAVSAKCSKWLRDASRIRAPRKRTSRLIVTNLLLFYITCSFHMCRLRMVNARGTLLYSWYLILSYNWYRISA